MIYVVRRNAYIHGQRLEDNFINNGTLQKWEKLTKPTTPIHPNGTSLEHSSGRSLKFSQRTHLQLLSTSLKLGWLTNEELPSIYKEKWGVLLHQPQQNCQHKLGTYLRNLSSKIFDKLNACMATMCQIFVPPTSNLPRKNHVKISFVG